MQKKAQTKWEKSFQMVFSMKGRQKVKKYYAWVIGSFVVATILCVFGQGMALFLSEHVVHIEPVYYLTGLTILGISLYAVTAIFLFFLFRNQEFVSDNREIYLMILGITAPSAFSWSFFVTVMWWG
ncbi:hypothetical protein [Planococcus sp. ISL-110]|uniref:hypothetical protein n=1 Tax=Planococcus sp. ISL-110 TaxID=2819167 RepID=UPI001BE97AE0|nr:hypothetical protein [Planococcus sp. ISL-110]MBT2569549.1 hypothetical protein [Planococcus sp. ISL-110]